MHTRRLLLTLLVLVVSAIVLIGPAAVPLGHAQPAPPPPPGAPPEPVETEGGSSAPSITPARASYLTGEVSFFRPGASDWAPARVNTPLAAGDALYTGPSGHVEIQVGPRAFVRAGENTQIGLDTQEPDFLQIRVVSGHAALDLRELPAGSVVELDTPGGAFTIEHAGYYRVDVAENSVTFATHRGGRATVTAAGGSAVAIPSNQQIVLAGGSTPRLETTAAPALTAWDRWNYQRTAYLLQPAATTANVPAGVYGTQELERYGSWRVAESYGPVWTPTAVPAGWVPYSTGRWIWDPVYGWTWLDDAPWGWAPYHHGRWVFLGNAWVWAPGPRIVRPVYSPALVVFLGGVSVSIGRPVAWAPLGWGEPLVPWWGRRGFVGVPYWGGWGGPRVVNNVVVHNTTVVQPITVYRNVTVVNAVVGVPAERFGRGQVQPTRFSHADVQQLAPVHGALPVAPVAASLAPASGPTPRPSPAGETRPIVATRPPHDVRPALNAHGLATSPAAERAPAPSLVPAPPRAVPPDRGPGAAASGSPVAPGGPATPGRPAAPRPGLGAPGERAPQRATPSDRPAPDTARREPHRAEPAPPGPDLDRRSPRPAPPSAPPQVERSPEAPPRRLPPQAVTPPRGPEPALPDRRGGPAISPPPAAPPSERPPAERAPRRESPPPQTDRPGRGDPPGRMERPDRSSREREWRGVSARIPARPASDARARRPSPDRLVYPHGAAH